MISFDVMRNLPKVVEHLDRAIAGRDLLIAICAVLIVSRPRRLRVGFGLFLFLCAVNLTARCTEATQRGVILDNYIRILRGGCAWRPNSDGEINAKKPQRIAARSPMN